MYGFLWLNVGKYNIHRMLWVWEVQEALESNNIFFGKEALKMFLLQREVLSHVYRFVFVLNRGTGTTITREISSQVAPQTLEPPHTAMNLQCQCLVQPPNHM